MADDIVPALLEMIQKEFDEQTAKDPKLIAAIKTLQAKKATYLDVNDFAIEVGQTLVGILGKHVFAESLPDGKMYFNIAQRLLDPTMKKNHELISGYALETQNNLNHQAGLHMRGQTVPVNQSRIDGIINRVSQEDDFEKIKWILEDPLINFSQSVVDDMIKANAEFQAKAGLHPKITRRVAGHACDWCKELAGTYDYQSEPHDIYRRHERCRCTVDYKPGDGRLQNVWSKAWQDPQKNAKIEARKLIGLDKKSPSIPSRAFIQQSIDKGLIKDEINVNKQARHVEGTRNGRSFIYGDLEDSKLLYEKLKTTGAAVLDSNGNWTKKERVQNDSPVGKYVNLAGEVSETNNATIVYSKTGSHIFPRKERLDNHES